MIEVIRFEEGLDAGGKDWAQLAALDLQHGWQPLDPGVYQFDNHGGRMIMLNRLVVTLDGTGKLTTIGARAFNAELDRAGVGRAMRIPESVVVDEHTKFYAVTNCLVRDVDESRIQRELWPGHLLSLLRLTGLIRYNPANAAGS